MNPVLALMEMDSPDTFAEDVANAYFQNPAHVRKILNENCIESCIQYIMDSQVVELDLNDLPENQDGWTKPSRKNRRKHDKKETKRKGNAKRFRDRSRKCAHEGHMWKVYHRGMAGDWSVRGRRLAETGEVTTRRFHHKDFSGEVEKIMEPNMCVSNIYYPDGSRISVEMNLNDWYEYNKELATLREQVEQTKKSGYDDLDFDSRDYVDYDFDDGDDDEIIDEPKPKKQYHTSEFTAMYDTSEFTAMELAQMSMKLACANPEQRALIREFMKTL